MRGAPYSRRRMSAARINAGIGVLAVGLVLGLVLGARVGGPGDLYDKDQPKTMAATVDIVRNGAADWRRIIWPRDMIGEPATKPPMYNWLDAIVLALSPNWGEWTFKLPSMIAALAIAGMIIVTVRRMLASHPHGDVIALLAAAVWLTSTPVMKQMYLSRPDMVMTAFITGAWVLATRAMDAPTARATRYAVGFWLCVAGAALSKGPAAMIPIVYVPLAAKLIHGRWRNALRVQWFAGVAILIATVGAWGILAYRAWPEAFFGVLLSEGASRFTTGGPEAIAKPVYLPAWWFLTNWAPWSLLAGLAVLMMNLDPRRWMGHALSPALVWVVLTIVAFSIAPGKRADYLLPAYPVAAMLAAFGMVELLRRIRLPVAVAAVAPVAMAFYLSQYELRRSPEATSGHTRALLVFMREVDSVVQRDEPTVSVVKGYQPYLTLLHRYGGNRARMEDLTYGTWILAPRDDAWTPYAISALLPDVVQVEVKKIVPGQVGLYRIGDEGVTPEALLPLLAEQEAWNFPPDRYRATRKR